MNPQKTAISGLAATTAAVALFWLMGMNFCGWLGAWLTPGAAWLVGILMALAAGLGFAALWHGTLARQAWAKRLPPVVASLLYGVAVGLLFVLLVPVILSALAGNPGMVHSTMFDGAVTLFGGHVVPALPDLFNPPFASWIDDEWIQRDAFAARLVPFLLAFALYGLVLGLTSSRSK